MNRAPTIGRSADSTNEFSVTRAVVEAVADAKGVSPLEVNPPLATVIDPDALETFVESADDQSASADSCIEFTYSGYQVSVGADGTADVSKL